MTSTDHNRTVDRSRTLRLNRRDVLKATGLTAGAFAFGGIGVRSVAVPVAASSHITETIYLSHSVDSENVTKLFSVDLDSTPGEAVLTLVTSIGGNFQNVDAIAATPDGATVMFVDRNTAHLGEYDVGADSFTDLGQITGLPTVTVLAAYGLDGKLYAASNTTNKLYTVDDSVSPPVANEVGTITGATVNGADIVVDSTGTMFLHSNSDDTLYTVDYQNPSGGNVAATAVGTDAGSSLTGLAVRAAGTGDLVGSSRTDDAIIVLDKTDGSRDSTHDMTLNGNPYSYTNGDMATGTIIDETCDACAFDGSFKFEYDEETDSFVLELEEGETFDDISYVSYVSKDDETGEPVSVTFETDICADRLDAFVKAGGETGGVDVTAGDDAGTVVVSIVDDERFENDNNGKLYAISYVEFVCAEDDTVDESGSTEVVTTTDDGDDDRGHGNDDDGHDEDNPGRSGGRGNGRANGNRGNGR